MLAFQPTEPARAQSEFSAPPPCLFSSPLPGGDGARLCVRQQSYDRDICIALERFAAANTIPPDYFARLIWRESLFRADAVSPKGAEGIAQFIPSTARMRGLENSFDPLQALSRSAEYLAALRDRYGNLGLASAAYNAGEAGLENFLASGRLPFETRAYVIAITAHDAETWKVDPPEEPDFRLDAGRPFIEACVALANTRRLKEMLFADEGQWAPWGVQLAAHFSKATAHRLFRRAVARLPDPLNAEKPLIQRNRNARPGVRSRYTARIARQTRDEAEDLCATIRSHGGSCTVFKN
ncbi:lytic transglycosylase domain-containing protein [Rhizobiaceae bacterium n13]|uniref:Lytic transglycosylase domain-containing protein n=2 Tax=Ferirhizobium litorale TaxID=2927786 RepID=A0AAE3QBW6_9HYPH|nr:lytic transglycosylase domain-containing protein [Fererhizobium litorale]MDI7860912.1 lytic transglycosylase domain-containing protein [Fererhizobium litorale]MDI7921060.1 lytic transglycosylase domain-containing protein [Fererhizobium litorale]